MDKADDQNYDFESRSTIRIVRLRSLSSTYLNSMSRHNEWILILDYGSQLTQLIARRLRELNIYCEIHPYNVDLAQVITPAFGNNTIGNPMSVNDDGAPTST